MTGNIRERLDHALRALAAAPADPQQALLSVGLAHPVLAECQLAPVRITGMMTEAAVPKVAASRRQIPHEREPISFTLVSLGVRPALLEHGSIEDMADLAHHAAARGLAALFAPYAFDPSFDPKRQGYSNLMRRCGPLDAAEGSWRGLLVSAEPRCVMLAWIALAAGWDQLLGRILGYPACCVDAFVANWPEDRSRWRGDPAARLLAAPRDPSLPLPWRSNVFARYRSPCLIEHFPCQFDCPASLALTFRFENCLDRMRPDITQAARRAMRGLVYEDSMGVEVWPGGTLHGDVISLPEGGTQSRIAGLRVTPDGVWRDGDRVDARFAAFTAESSTGLVS